ncbi:MAG: TldD/PmbA family protein [Myxococcales bacterium]|nr:TldD/PmbA family protein [Myxococcales bacterium]
MTLTKQKAQAITKAALKARTVDELVVHVSASTRGYLRFSQNQAAATGETEGLEVSVTATHGGRSATVSGNDTDKGALEALVADAEALAKLAPADPEHMPLLGPQRYVEVDAEDAKTAKMGAEERFELTRQLLRVANKARLHAAGMITHDDGAYALANSAGLFAYHRSTQAEISMTCRTSDGTGSGWAAAVDHRVEKLDAKAIAERAAEKADLSQKPEEHKPGVYTVVLEPQAVADLLSFLGWSLDRRSADEGRSAFAKPGGGTKIGEALFHKSINLRSEPANAEHPSAPFAGDGQPLGPVTWIDKGVLKALSCSRFWAQKEGLTPLPRPGSFFLDGAGQSDEALIRGVDEGILVTRFWYNRMLEPQTILATGLTRDGTFLIKGGKIAKSIKNLRYNESPLTLLKNVLALGEPKRVALGGRVVVVPTMVVGGFTFSSLSDAV